MFIGSIYATREIQEDQRFTGPSGEMPNIETLTLLAPCLPFTAPNTFSTLKYWNQSYSNPRTLTVPTFAGIHQVPD